MASIILGNGTGWLREYPDFRDYTLEHEGVQKLLGNSRLVREPRAAIPGDVDLRRWCPPVENQGALGSCTAQAGVGLVEYYERRAFGKHLDASRLFLYKVTRNLLNLTGDTGAFMRSTLQSMVLFGVPPEEYWPYNISNFDDEPSAFCYAFAQNYQTQRYLRLDPPGMRTEDLLSRIKMVLARGYVCSFGFTVFNSISEATDNGEIPFPGRGDRVAGGHAVMAVGYDDARSIDGRGGAILIRNSWGRDWGQDGYGWLPYDYIRAGLAVDWWTVLRQEWVDTGNFE